MPRRRDPNFTTGHLCRFCGQLIPWGSILRIIRTDPDTPGYMLNETACHTECLAQLLRPGLTLTFPRHWEGRGPMPNDDADIFPAHPEEARSAVSKDPICALCALPIAPAALVRLRVQRPTGPVKRPEFDEQSLPVHFDCLAAVSTMRFG